MGDLFSWPREVRAWEKNMPEGRYHIMEGSTIMVPGLEGRYPATQHLTRVPSQIAGSYGNTVLPISPGNSTPC